MHCHGITDYFIQFKTKILLLDYYQSGVGLEHPCNKKEYPNFIFENLKKSFKQKLLSHLIQIRRCNINESESKKGNKDFFAKLNFSCCCCFCCCLLLLLLLLQLARL